MMRRFIGLLLALGGTAHAADFSKQLGPAHVELTSDGKGIDLLIAVKDSKNPVNLWLSAVSAPTTYIKLEGSADIAGYLLVDGKPDLAAFRRERKRPHLTPCGDNPDPADRDHAISLLFGNENDHYVDERVLFGTVNFVLYSDGRPAERWGREAYGNLALGPIEKGVTYTTEPTAGGYVIHAHLAPEAFGFVPREGLSRFRMQVVVNASSPGYTDVALARPIPIELVPGVTHYDDAWPAVFMRGVDGWEAMRVETVPLSDYVGRCEWTDDHVTRTWFMHGKVTEQKAETSGGHAYRVFDLGGPEDAPEKLVLVDGERAVRVAGYHGAFTFADGVPGFVASEERNDGFPMGHCGAASVIIPELVRLVPGTAKKVDLGVIDSCRNYASFGKVDVHIKDDVGEFGEVMRWHEPGRSLDLNLPGEEGPAVHVRLTWDADGSNPRASQLK
jgi:hypothetical protein